MTQRLILALALCLTLAMPAAAADVNGIYLGAKFIDSMQSKWSNGDVNIGGISQNTVGGGVFVGYDFYPQHQFPLRAEIEYAIRSDVTRSESDSVYASAANHVNADLKGTWNLQTLMANVYFDFHNSTAFTPYIGAGIGMGFVRSDYEMDMQGVIGGVPFATSASKSTTDTVLAWNVGAGCAYAFNDNISADLGYRYVGVGESETTWMGETLKVSGGAHEFSLGLRFTF